jgi:hypothetical protein
MGVGLQRNVCAHDYIRGAKESVDRIRALIEGAEKEKKVREWTTRDRCSATSRKSLILRVFGMLVLQLIYNLLFGGRLFAPQVNTASMMRRGVAKYSSFCQPTAIPTEDRHQPQAAS